MRISYHALKELNAAIIDEKNYSVKLTNQLDKDIYKEIGEVFKRLRGKWNKKNSLHQFEDNPKPKILAILETKEMPPKNPTAYFPTPVNLIHDMIDIADFKHHASFRKVRVLEPSAGDGRIASVITNCKGLEVVVDLVEFLPLNQNLLKQKGFNPICGDFMEYNKDYDIKYDYVFMNPPYSLEHDKKAYITHVEHAFKMLEWNGTLIAILPTSWISNTTKKERDFLDFVAEHGCIYRNEKESFKESGTLIDTVIVELQKISWKNKPYCGFDNYFIWSLFLSIDNVRKYQKKYQKLTSQLVAPSDDEIINFLDECITYFSKEDNFHSRCYMDSYLKHFKKMRENELQYIEDNSIKTITVKNKKDVIKAEDTVLIETKKLTVEPIKYRQATLF